MYCHHEVKGTVEESVSRVDPLLMSWGKVAMNLNHVQDQNMGQAGGQQIGSEMGVKWYRIFIVFWVGVSLKSTGKTCDQSW